MTVREIALSLLDEYEAGDKYANLALSSHLLDKLSAGERKFVTHLFYTAVERKLTYDYYICALSGRSLDKIDKGVLNILRLGFAQLLGTDSVPSYAAVNETVSLCRGKGERAFVNGVLRAAVRAVEKGELPMPKREKNAARYLSVKHSFPLWICKEFVSSFGEEEAEKLLVSINGAGYTDLTVNTCRIGRDEFLRKLREGGIEASPSLYSDIGVRIPYSVDVKELFGFCEGYFFVQDEAGAVSASALSPKPCDVIVDVCSAPGGKSFAAEVLAGGEAKIFAFDIHNSKLSLIEGGAKRLGFEKIAVECCDAREGKDTLFGKADRVICDCPCSGLGVLGKKADLRYRDSSKDAYLPDLQYEILCRAKDYLKIGGEMIYSTCTLRECENRGVVKRFLDGHPGFCAVDFEVGALSSNEGMLTLLPHVHSTDGFFIAKLKRIK